MPCRAARVCKDLLRRVGFAVARGLGKPLTDTQGRYLSPHILIIDELGYLPCDNRSADLLYNIVSRRHESKSTVITTNLAYMQWGTVFPGAACVVALVDRFVQHCHVIDIDADSWRQKSKASSPKKAK